MNVAEYKTIKIDDSERYAVLRTADMNTKFNIYEVVDYKGPRNFRIPSSEPVGTFEPMGNQLVLFRHERIFEEKQLQDGVTQNVKKV